MFHSEVPAEIIAAKIRMASAYCFDVSVGTIKQLRSSGVPDQIILAMVSRGDARRPEYRRSNWRRTSHAPGEVAALGVPRRFASGVVLVRG